MGMGFQFEQHRLGFELGFEKNNFLGNGISTPPSRLSSRVDPRGQSSLLWDVSSQYKQVQGLPPCCRVLKARRDWRSNFGGGGGSTELDSTGLRRVHDFKAAHNCRKSQLCQSSSLRTKSPRIPGNLSMVRATFPFTLFNFPGVSSAVQQPFVNWCIFWGWLPLTFGSSIRYPSHRPSPLRRHFHNVPSKCSLLSRGILRG